MPFSDNIARALRNYYRRVFRYHPAIDALRRLPSEDKSNAFKVAECFFKAPPSPDDPAYTVYSEVIYSFLGLDGQPVRYNYHLLMIQVNHMLQGLYSNRLLTPENIAFLRTDMSTNLMAMRSSIIASLLEEDILTNNNFDIIKHSNENTISIIYSELGNLKEAKLLTSRNINVIKSHPMTGISSLISNLHEAGLFSYENESSILLCSDETLAGIIESVRQLHKSELLDQRHLDFVLEHPSEFMGQAFVRLKESNLLNESNELYIASCDSDTLKNLVKSMQDFSNLRDLNEEHFNIMKHSKSPYAGYALSLLLDSNVATSENTEFIASHTGEKVRSFALAIVNLSKSRLLTDDIRAFILSCPDEVRLDGSFHPVYNLVASEIIALGQADLHTLSNIARLDSVRLHTELSRAMKHLPISLLTQDNFEKLLTRDKDNRIVDNVNNSAQDLGLVIEVLVEHSLLTQENLDFILLATRLDLNITYSIISDFYYSNMPDNEFEVIFDLIKFHSAPAQNSLLSFETGLHGLKVAGWDPRKIISILQIDNLGKNLNFADVASVVFTLHETKLWTSRNRAIISMRNHFSYLASNLLLLYEKNLLTQDTFDLLQSKVTPALRNITGILDRLNIANLLNKKNLRTILSRQDDYLGLQKAIFTLHNFQLLTQDNFNRLLDKRNHFLVTERSIHAVWERFDANTGLRQDLLNGLFHVARAQNPAETTIDFMRLTLQALNVERVQPQINQAQSTHTQSIHATSSDAAKSLRDLYVENLQGNKLEETIEKLRHYASGLSNSHRDMASKRFIEKVLGGDFHYIDKFSQVTLQELLLLSFIALEDETNRAGMLEDAREQFIQGLYESQRDGNLSAAGVDNGYTEDAPNCPAGSFNKLIEKLQGIHECCKLVAITPELATLKLQRVVYEEALSYLFAQHSTLSSSEFSALIHQVKSNDVVAIWENIKGKVSERLFNEFGSLYRGRDDSRFLGLIDAGLYADIDFSSIERAIQDVDRPSTSGGVSLSTLCDHSFSRKKREAESCLDRLRKKAKDIEHIDLSPLLPSEEKDMAILLGVAMRENMNVSAFLEDLQEVMEKPEILKTKTDRHDLAWIKNQAKICKANIFKRQGAPEYKCDHINNLEDALNAMKPNEGSIKVMLKVGDDGLDTFLSLLQDNHVQWFDSLLFKETKEYSTIADFIKDFSKIYPNDARYDVYNSPSLEDDTYNKLQNILFLWEKRSESGDFGVRWQKLKQIFSKKGMGFSLDEALDLHQLKQLAKRGKLHFRPKDFIKVTDFNEIELRLIRLLLDTQLRAQTKSTVYEGVDSNEAITRIFMEIPQEHLSVKELERRLSDHAIETYFETLDLSPEHKTSIIAKAKAGFWHVAQHYGEHARSLLWWIRSAIDASHGNPAGLAMLGGLEAWQRIGAPAVSETLLPRLTKLFGDEVAGKLLKGMGGAPGAVFALIPIGSGIDKLANAKTDLERTQGAVELVEGVAYLASSILLETGVGIIVDALLMAGFSIVEGELIFKQEERAYRIVEQHTVWDALRRGLGFSIKKFGIEVEESKLEAKITVIVEAVKKNLAARDEGKSLVDVIGSAYPDVIDTKTLRISLREYLELKTLYPEQEGEGRFFWQDHEQSLSSGVEGVPPSYYVVYDKKVDTLAPTSLSLDSSESTFRPEQVLAEENFAPWLNESSSMYVAVPHQDPQLHTCQPDSYRGRMNRYRMYGQYYSQACPEELRSSVIILPHWNPPPAALTWYACGNRYFLQLFQSSGNFFAITAANPTSEDRRRTPIRLPNHHELATCEPISYNFHVLLIAGFTHTAQFTGNANHQEELHLRIMQRGALFPETFYPLSSSRPLELALSHYKQASITFASGEQVVQIKTIRDVEKLILDFSTLSTVTENTVLQVQADRISLGDFYVDLPASNAELVIKGHAHCVNHLHQIPSNTVSVWLPKCQLAPLNEVNFKLDRQKSSPTVYLAGPGTKVTGNGFDLVYSGTQGPAMSLLLNQDNQPVLSMILKDHLINTGFAISGSKIGLLMRYEITSGAQSNIVLTSSTLDKVMISTQYQWDEKSLPAIIVLSMDGTLPKLVIHADTADRVQLKRHIVNKLPESFENMFGVVSAKNQAGDTFDRVVTIGKHPGDSGMTHEVVSISSPKRQEGSIQLSESVSLQPSRLNDTSEETRPSNLPSTTNPLSALLMTANGTLLDLKKLNRYDKVFIRLAADTKQLDLKVFDIVRAYKRYNHLHLVISQAKGAMTFSDEDQAIVIQNYFNLERQERPCLQINGIDYKVKTTRQGHVHLDAEFSPMGARKIIHKQSLISASQGLLFLGINAENVIMDKNYWRAGRHILETTSFPNNTQITFRKGIPFALGTLKKLAVIARINLHIFRPTPSPAPSHVTSTATLAPNAHSNSTAAPIPQQRLGRNKREIMSSPSTSGAERIKPFMTNTQLVAFFLDLGSKMKRLIDSRQAGTDDPIIHSINTHSQDRSPASSVFFSLDDCYKAESFGGKFIVCDWEHDQIHSVTLRRDPDGYRALGSKYRVQSIQATTITVSDRGGSSYELPLSDCDPHDQGLIKCSINTGLDKKTLVWWQTMEGKSQFEYRVSGAITPTALANVTLSGNRLTLVDLQGGRQVFNLSKLGKVALEYIFPYLSEFEQESLQQQRQAVMQYEQMLSLFKQQAAQRGIEYSLNHLLLHTSLGNGFQCAGFKVNWAKGDPAHWLFRELTTGRQLFLDELSFSSKMSSLSAAVLETAILHPSVQAFYIDSIWPKLLPFVQWCNNLSCLLIHSPGQGHFPEEQKPLNEEANIRDVISVVRLFCDFLQFGLNAWMFLPTLMEYLLPDLSWKQEVLLAIRGIVSVMLIGGLSYFPMGIALFLLPQLPVILECVGIPVTSGVQTALNSTEQLLIQSTLVRSMMNKLPEVPEDKARKQTSEEVLQDARQRAEYGRARIAKGFGFCKN